jgi:hypothetical protein
MWWLLMACAPELAPPEGPVERRAGDLGTSVIAGGPVEGAQVVGAVGQVWQGALGAAIDADGVAVRGRGDGFRLRAAGPAVVLREGACEAVLPEGCARRVERQLGPDVVEWWTPTDGGLRQGWTVTPGGPRFVVEVRMEGAVWAQEADGRVWIQGEAGAWRYDGLAAWDADGRRLALDAEVDGASLWITVEGDPGVAPWVIDPVIRQDATVVAGPLAVTDHRGDACALGNYLGTAYGDFALGGFPVPFATVWQGNPAGDWVPYSPGFGGNRCASGDIDGDGFDDVIHSTDTASFGFHLSPMSGRDAQVREAGPDRLAVDVSLGDVNGDGVLDAAVGVVSRMGAPGGRRSGVQVYRGGGGFRAGDAWPTLRGGTTSAFGRFVDIGGDGNGDGFDDLLASHPGCDLTQFGGPLCTDAYFFPGGPAGLSRTSTWGLRSVFQGGGDFLRASWAGDLNGDGFDDAAFTGVETPLVVFGGRGGLAAEATRLEGAEALWADATAAFVDREYDKAVMPAGDVNGDGLDDIVLAYPGGAAVYFGSPDGIVPGATWMLEVGDPTWARLARGVGDVNGDGFDDVMVVAPDATGGVGLAALFLGHAVADIDLDGVDNGADCDPYDGRVFGGAQEIAGNEVDEDCDGAILCHVDADGDGAAGAGTVSVPAGSCAARGYSRDAPDCWDADPALGPQAAEVAHNDVDEDCDGYVLCFADEDEDGFGGRLPALIEGAGCSTAPAYDADGLDCDDTRAEVNPAAPETAATSFDDDCDGAIACFVDADGDGYGDPRAEVPSPFPDCAWAGASDVGLDCDDTDDQISPADGDLAEIVGDGIDQDCDGGDACPEDQDGDGWSGDVVDTEMSCASHSDPRIAAAWARWQGDGDCYDMFSEINPGEVEDPNDLIDNDCDGWLACYTADRDGDGYGGAGDAWVDLAAPVTDGPYGGRCDFGLVPGGDCAPDEPSVHPAPWGDPHEDAHVVGVDHDCDGRLSCLRDGDWDGYGSTAADAIVQVPSCSATGVSVVPGDCNDRDAAVFPGALESTVDGVDRDCDGVRMCYVDVDGDGAPGPVIVGLPTCDAAGAGTAVEDCDDGDAAVGPDAAELPQDGVDQDCDGIDDLALSVRVDGAVAWLEVRGATPGRTVGIVTSPTGPGAGPCPPQLGGTCVAVRSATLIVARPARPDGRLTWAVAAPVSPRWFQAFARPAAGGAWWDSDVVEAGP